jgi:hypothetical protein
VSYFAGKNRFAHTIWLFRRCIYLFLLANTLTLLPGADRFWGENSFSLETAVQEHFYSPLVYFLSARPGGLWYKLFLAGQIIFIFLGFSGKYPRLSAVMVFFTTINLFYRAQLVANGGYQIVLIMLFYMMFMEEKKEDKDWPVLNITANVFSNLALVAARIQLVLLYAFAGINKLQGELWLKGEALYYALSLDEFSHTLVKNWLVSSDWFIIPGNYLALAYQLLFPVLIWFKKIRAPMLLAGVALHLCIAFMMGLMDFGFAMIACYPVFFSSEGAASLKAGIKKISIKGD